MKSATTVISPHLIFMGTGYNAWKARIEKEICLTLNWSQYQMKNAQMNRPYKLLKFSSDMKLEKGIKLKKISTSTNLILRIFHINPNLMSY